MLSLNLLFAIFPSRLQSVLAEYRRPILWGLGIFFLVYSYFIFNFLFGNHDWGMIFTPAFWGAKAWQSRPFAFLPLQLWQGFYLPVLTPVASLLAYFCAGVLFLALFAPTAHRQRSFFLGLALFALSPTLLGRLYYEGAGIGENFALCAFLVGTHLGAREKGVLPFLTAVALFTFALGVNQCIINSFWTLFLLLLLAFPDASRPRNIFRYGYAFAIALVVYLLLIKVVIPDRPFYNNQVAGWEVFVKNLLPQLKASIAYFWQPQPPMNGVFKAFFSLLCLGGFCRLLLGHRPTAEDGGSLCLWTSRPARLILLMLLFVTNNVSAYVSGDAGANTFNLRMDYYSVPFLLSFCALTVVQIPGLTGRLFTAAAAVLVILSMGSDVRALQVWKISIEDDMLYANRMLARIEAAPEFDAHRSWRVIALGGRPVFGERFWRGYPHRSLELQRPLHLERNFAEVFNYIAPQLEIAAFSGERKEVCARHKAFLERAPAWPKSGSLMIDGKAGLILIVLEENAARHYCPR